MSKKRFLSIADPDNLQPEQISLFASEVKVQKYNPYPELRSSVEDVKRIIAQGAKEGKIGADFEFNDYRPTIFGVASLNEAAAVRWDNDLAQLLVDTAQNSGAPIIGHSTIGAEKEQLEKALNIQTAPGLYGCSMIGHHLVNGHLTKLAGKSEEEDAGSLGLMGLSTVATLETMVPQYKYCRGRDCSGPCPTHRVFDYCAVDAWTSLAASYSQDTQMAELGVPQSFYHDCIELTDICAKMEKTGLRIDRNWVKYMDTRGKEIKDSLFPFELVNNKPVYTQFNPKSGKKVLEYCKEKNISLKDTTKSEVAKVLEKRAKKEGITGETIKDLCAALETAPEVSEELDILFRLYQYKSAGKGVKSWFDDKYFGKDGRIHPRFITTGTCTGRLSSSRPNFQNLGARGWAKELKKAIIPDEGMDFVESDWSQLELRIILYLAGYDVKTIEGDAFMWIVQQNPGAFDKAGALMSMSPRDVAKSILHGSNYGEGIQIKSYQEMNSPQIQKELECGARVAYTKKYYPQLKKDWEFRGGVVTFTASNLSERIFGDKSLANRKKAHEIVEGIYFKEFFSIREWQMKVLEQAESGVIKAPTGRILKLYGTPEDDAKMAVAFLGQGVGADHARSVILSRKRLEGIIPILTVHDSVIQQIPKSWSNSRALEIMRSMQDETPLLPGYVNPGKVKRGPNYGEIELI